MANTKLARDAIKGLKSAKYRPINEDFFDFVAQETIKEHLNEKSKGERIDADGNSVWGKFHGEKEDLRPKLHHRSWYINNGAMYVHIYYLHIS